MGRIPHVGRRTAGGAGPRFYFAWLIAYLACAPIALAEDVGARGERLYQERCGGCHSLDDNGAGPRHRGLMGRRAGSQPGFVYSDALARADIVWSTETLNRWIADPNAVAPGNSMVVRLASDPADRAAIVAWLAAASGTEN
jgi:cytochrome c